MSVRNIQRLAKRVRWTARVIVLILTIFGAIMLIGSAVSEPLSQGTTTSLAGNLLVVIGIAALAGCVLSWWRDLLAGILLLATSAGLGAHIGTFAGRNHLMVWAILGLPYLIAGVLLLYARWLSRHRV